MPERRVSSLSGRLLASVSLLLILFFGVTIAALDLVFRNLSERSLHDLLDAQLVALVAASDLDDSDKLQPSGQLAEARLEQPGSGLYAEIRSAGGQVIWRSPSMLGTQLDFGAPVPRGKRRFARLRLPDGTPLMALSSGLAWEMTPGSNRDFEFSLATSLAPYEAQLQRFRGQLFGWFAALIVLLLLSLAVLLRWVLRPLRRIETEIREVEAGERAQLNSALPRELTGLATNMNALLASERQRLERYRNTLGNLAHSLKTPLAVMRTTLGEKPDPQAGVSVLNDQIDRMDAIVQHQLKRAAASGGSVVGQAPVDVGEMLGELRVALSKVYGHKDLLIELQVPERLMFHGDRGDLFELLGNLLDNACKWCRSRVRVIAAAHSGGSRPQLSIVIEDDGAGILPVDRERILQRGVRADEQVAGQGLGLAMVREIVELYGGRLSIGDSPLGGARITAVLPAK